MDTKVYIFCELQIKAIISTLFVFQETFFSIKEKRMNELLQEPKKGVSLNTVNILFVLLLKKLSTHYLKSISTTIIVHV